MGFTMGTLVVRGFWEGQEELVSALGPAVAGADEQGILLHPQAGVMRITLHPPDHTDAEHLRQQALAQKWPAHQLSALRSHTSVAALHYPRFLAHDSGALITVVMALRFAVTLLERGGACIKVEESGRTNNNDDWMRHVSHLFGLADAWARDQEDREARFSALTAAFDLLTLNAVFDGDRAYTCGNHLFATPDLMIAGGRPDRLTAFFPHWLRSPNLTTWSDSGETWRVGRCADTHHEPSSPYHNPHGYIVLEEV